MLNDVADKPIRIWDSRGFMRILNYDPLRRPVALSVTDSNSKTILAEKTIYGDSASVGPLSPELTNQRGKVY
jgi:hypothetical protein